MYSSKACLRTEESVFETGEEFHSDGSSYCGCLHFDTFCVYGT